MIEAVRSAGCHGLPIGASVWARPRCPPVVLFWRRSDETIFQSLRSRPEIIAR